ncbi:MAG: MFS transporter, partial [Deltaproteobacteria bacterium]|nr:MFS transporter [Deltaproteobacteria bacterium]
SRFLAFIVQPSVGYLADRYQTRFFILGGLLLPIIFIPLTGIASCFWMLLLFTALGSVGSSMFHPSVAGMVTLYARNHMGVAMSIFNMGGTLSFAVGPLFITWFVASYGLEATPVTMMLGLVVMLFLYRMVPMPQGEGLKKLGFIGSIRETIGPVWKPIFLIWLVMVLRALISQSFLTFLPVYYARQGFSLISIGTMVALFTVAGALSGLLSGYCGDRIGYKPVFIINFTLMTPVLFLFLNLTGKWIYPGVFLAGFFLLAAMPLGVVMAQKLVPKGRAMVSSLMMGFAYGLGGILTPVVGKLADIFSIREVLYYVSFLPVLILVVVFFFPGRPARRPVG